MKRITYLLLCLTIPIMMASVIEKENDDNPQTTGNRCPSGVSRLSSCEGCHRGSSVSGPIIIIYADGKRGDYVLPFYQQKEQPIVLQQETNEDNVWMMLSEITNHKPLFLSTTPTLEPYRVSIVGKPIESDIFSQASDNPKEVSTGNVKNSNAFISTQNNMSIWLDMKTAMPANVRLYSITGRLIASKEFLFSEGENELTIPFEHDKSERFIFVSVRAGLETITRKVYIP